MQSLFYFGPPRFPLLDILLTGGSFQDLDKLQILHSADGETEAQTSRPDLLPDFDNTSLLDSGQEWTWPSGECPGGGRGKGGGRATDRQTDGHGEGKLWAGDLCPGRGRKTSCFSVYFSTFLPNDLILVFLDKHRLKVSLKKAPDLPDFIFPPWGRQGLLGDLVDRQGIP